MSDTVAGAADHMTVMKRRLQRDHQEKLQKYCRIRFVPNLKKEKTESTTNPELVQNYQTQLVPIYRDRDDESATDFLIQTC